MHSSPGSYMALHGDIAENAKDARVSGLLDYG